jgi:hypothetical protein
LTDDLSQRVARLEARVDGMEKRQDEAAARIDKLLNNELKHIVDRVSSLEVSESGSISKGDWAKILIAIIGAAGLVLATVIQYVVGR